MVSLHYTEKSSSMKELLDPSLICYLEQSNRKSILEALIDKAYLAGKFSDKKDFRKAIFKREGILSTGIGIGVALPHARVSGIEDFFVCVGILAKAVDWDAIDKKPVRLVFLIGGPDNRQTEYLRVLSKVTYAIKDEENRRQIMSSECPADVIRLLAFG